MREGGESAGALAAMSGYDTANLALPERHEDGSYTVPIRILRIHMEEDAAKMVHVGGEEGASPRPASRSSTTTAAARRSSSS